MRIAIALHTPKSAHSAVYLGYRTLAARWGATGHDVTIVAPEDFATLRRLHARWYALLYPFWLAAWFRRVRSQWDVVVCHSYAGWVINLLRISGRRRVVVTAFHGVEPLYYAALSRELARTGRRHRLRFRFWHGFVLPKLIKVSTRRSALVLCLNREERAFLVDQQYADPARIAVVGRPIASQFFLTRGPRPMRRLLFVARWEDGKGIRYLAPAFSELAAARVDLELWCVGTLASADTVREAFPPEIRSRVVVLERIDQGDLPEIYQGADLFVLPSLSEAFSVALLEGMAAALPIVSTRTGVALEALVHEQNCLLVPMADAAAIRDAVLRLADDARLRIRLGQAAQQAARRYEADRVAAEFQALLTAAIEGRS